MTCKDCIHYDMCYLLEHYVADECCEDCDHFKDKSRILELPCKVGDTVYQTDFVRIYESTIVEITLSGHGVLYITESIVFDDRAIGLSIFLTREEAEEALRKAVEK